MSTMKEVRSQVTKMASNLESSFNRGSDIFFDFSCFTCKENDSNTGAECYCEECSKFYCSTCVEYHNFLYKKHSILDKENISQWPETNVGELEKCKDHRKELTGFCEDHSELICHACHINKHQKCSHVVLIADKVKDLHQKGSFKQLSATVDTRYWQLIHKKDDFEENIKSLEKSYKQSLDEINALRKIINDSLNQLEKNTKKELDTLLATTRTSIQTDIEYCMKYIKNITRLKEDCQRIKDKSEALSFIKYRKCLDQSLKVEAVVQEMTTKNERTLQFNPDTTIQQTLSTLSGLGKIMSKVKKTQSTKMTTQSTETRQNKPKASEQSYSENQTIPGFMAEQSSRLLVKGYQTSTVSKKDQTVKMKSSKMCSMAIKGDLDKCSISGICETATGELLITDLSNCKVKLLDQAYKVVAHFDLHGTPGSMCSIDSHLVTVTDYDSEVHFIRVINGLLIKDKKLTFEHACCGISHHQGKLYITDGNALYHYTMDGRLVSKLYEDDSKEGTVTSCAVSPGGDRIYVLNEVSAKLITLSRYGTVISSLTHPALVSRSHISSSRLHVTDSGQVLVCAYSCNAILQADKNGRQILSEVVSENDGVAFPTSVCYSKHTGALIVGIQHNDNDIIVFNSE